MGADAVGAALALVATGGPFRLVEVGRLPGLVDLIGCATRAARRDSDGVWSTAPGGAGVGLCWEEALLSTVGEAIERLALHPDEEARRQIERASDRALQRPAIDPECFNFFLDAFYGGPEAPRETFSRDKEIPWFPARSLRDAGEVLVPAEYVFFSCEAVPNHHWFCTTSGLASHRSPEAALCNALYELVERDAFVTTWLRGEGLAATDPESCRDGEIDEVVARSARAGVSLHLRDMGGELGIPSYLAIAEAEAGGEPAIGVGAASRLDPVGAARKALLEAVHTWNWAYLKVDGRGLCAPVDDLVDFPLREFGDHVYLYAHSWMKDRVGFLLDDETRRAPRRGRAAASPERELWETVDRLEAAGFRVFAVDQTPVSMRARGYFVMRAVVPELLPIQTGWRIQQLRSSRAPTDRNPDPHPFP